MEPSASSLPCSLPQIERDRLASMWSQLIAGIHHDCTAPLSRIRLDSQVILSHMPALLKAYDLALEKNLIESTISITDQERLMIIPQETTVIIGELFAFLRWLQPIHSEILSRSDKAETVSAHHFIQGFVSHALFSDVQRESIVITQSDDFIFKSTDFFTQNILLFLATTAKNAWGESESNTGLPIEIKSAQHEAYNTISLKMLCNPSCTDYPPHTGMKNFFFKKESEMNIGLCLCELAFMQLGGELRYEFVPNEYISFLLQYAKITD